MKEILMTKDASKTTDETTTKKKIENARKLSFEELRLVQGGCEACTEYSGIGY